MLIIIRSRVKSHFLILTEGDSHCTNYFFQSSDSFSFDVTNGISGLQDLVFHFRILPKTLYIDTREMIVTEGGNVNLATNNIRVSSREQTVEAKRLILRLFCF